MATVKNRIPDVILDLMEKHNITTQKEMARRLNMDQGAFSRLLRMSPSDSANIPLMARLHTEFGVTPNDLLLEIEG